MEKKQYLLEEEQLKRRITLLRVVYLPTKISLHSLQATSVILSFHFRKIHRAMAKALREKTKFLPWLCS